jgi:hypothetical protein
MGNDVTSNEKTNASSEDYEELTSIEEHELNYQRRLRRIEFIDGSSQIELLKNANSSLVSSLKTSTNSLRNGSYSCSMQQMVTYGETYPLNIADIMKKQLSSTQGMSSYYS